MNVINSISEFHRLVFLPEPMHPLVSVVRVADMRFNNDAVWNHFSLNFFCISLKRDVLGKVKYGQQYYDYDKGLMTFIAPKQVRRLMRLMQKYWVLNRERGMRCCYIPIFCTNIPLQQRSKITVFFLTL